VALVALLLAYYLALSSLVNDSPTMDEQNHLARGLAFLGTGDPRFSVEHPPLINAISALPVHALLDINLPTDHPSWTHPEGWYAFAEEMLWVRNREQAGLMVFLARLPIVWLFLAMALVGFRFARRFWRGQAGLLTLLLLLLDPNLMAHGRYTTTDLGGTLILLVATMALWKLWSAEKSKMSFVAAAGVALGLALGSKLSNLVFMPIFALLAVLPLYDWGHDWRGAGLRLLRLAAAASLALLVVWAVYGFEWGAFRFVSPGWSTLNSATGPAPTLLAGIEQIVRISGGGRPSFLMGQFSDEGFWYYFPVAFAVKTPLVSQLAMLLAAALLLAKRRTRLKAAWLLIPFLAFFLVSMQSALNIGYRHLLPILPFLYVTVGGVTGSHNDSARWARTNWLPPRAPAALLVAALLLVNLGIYPHYLSFFNPLAGGPANGFKVLVDSNIDWGQDLIRLQQWTAAQGDHQIKLSWFGSADPSYYGLEYEPLPGLPRHFELWWDPPFEPTQPEPGTYAISVSNLWELPLADKEVFAWFREREPDARVGYSIHIYQVGAEAGPAQ
jgi:4-amino-4-deoxy-L-arabinose transferase-like glycosyltransferase